MSNVSEQHSKDADMSTADLARDLVIAAAMPRGAFDNRKSMLARAAARLGIGYRRAKAIFYGEARLIGADEWRELVARADALGIKQSWEKTHEEYRESNEGRGRLPPQPVRDPARGGAVPLERVAEERRAATHSGTAGESLS